MKKYFFLFVVFCSAACIPVFSQSNPDNRVKVSYRKNILGDTLLFTVTKPLSVKKGTLQVISNLSGRRETDTAYFPIIDTANFFILVTPLRFLKEKVNISALYYPEIFNISGKCKSKKPSDPIMAVLITDNQQIFNRQVNLDAENSFSLPPMVFENRGNLMFNYNNGKKKNTKHPNMSIFQNPLPENFRDTVFNEQISYFTDTTTEAKKVFNTIQEVIQAADSVSNAKSLMLENVTVKGVRKSKAEKFNEENSTGLFNSPDERVIDCLDNDDVLSFPDCLSFLRSKVAGLNVQIDQFGENKIFWRGHETKAFFIDEIPVDIDQLLSVPVTDIAIVKAYPPPFNGSTSGGDGGAIAIYIRRGADKRPGIADDNNWLFSIRGYSPAVRKIFNTRSK